MNTAKRGFAWVRWTAVLGLAISAGHSLLAAADTPPPEAPAALGSAPAGQDSVGVASPLCHLKDWGDAPDDSTYQFRTLSANLGAFHWLDQYSSSPFMGGCVDSEADGQPNVAATGDDAAVGGSTYGKCTTAGDDEDGVTFTSGIFPGASAGVDVDMVASPKGCWLSAWMDFDRDGNWYKLGGGYDAGEQIFDEVWLENGSVQELSFAVPAAAIIGDTYARFRCSFATKSLGAKGEAGDGEVEDYLVKIEKPESDWGDAPDPSYPTLSASGGALHYLVSGGPFLGAVVDAELDGQPSVGAVGDDNDVAPDDEDGVCFCAGPVMPGVATEVRVDMTGSPQSCVLSAWIDWNADGSWTGDQIVFTSGANPVLAPGSVYHLGYTPPAGATEGVTYARFRCTSEAVGPVGYDGAARDGEVEDYELLISEVPVEFGDLPDGYGTLLGSAGAYHFTNGLFLGTQMDGEGNGTPSYDSEGDDTCGLVGDDEDGAAQGGPWEDGTAELEVATSGGSGCLNVWLDFTDGSAVLSNGDGDFDDTYLVGGTFPEHVIQNHLLAAGNNSLNFPLPVGATDNARWYMRVRLTPEDAAGGCANAEAYGAPAAAPAAGEMSAQALAEVASPTGPAQGGEVEDYVFSFGPTAVTLTELEARPGFDLWVGGLGLALAALGLGAAGWFLARRRLA